MRLRKQMLPLLALALVLALTAPLAAAQVGRVRVDGSPALFPFAQTSGLAFSETSTDEILVNISGPEAAFMALCTNALDIATSDRPITDEELASCDTRGVQVVELAIARDGLAVYSSNPDAECVTLDDLAAAYGEGGPAVFGRGREYQQYFMRVVGIDALRDDFGAFNDDLAVGGALLDAGGDAYGFVSLAGALAAGQAPLAIDAGEGCVAPDEDTISNNQYPLARTLYFYVNVGSGEQLPVANFVSYILSAGNLSRLPELGLIPLDEDSYTLDANNWNLRVPGRTFSAPPIVVEASRLETSILAEIGPDLIVYTGSAEIQEVAEPIAESITAVNAGLTFDFLDTSSTEALTRFCNGEADLIGMRRAINDTELIECISRGVGFIELPVGLNPLVVVANPDNDYAQCITLNTLNLIFGAANEGAITRWIQMREGYPDTELVIYLPDGPAAGAFSEMIGPLRTDVNEGGVLRGVIANEDAVGLVSFGDYIAAGDQVQGVAIDAGAGCVAPTAENIQGGAYPLNQPLYLYVNWQAVERPTVEALAGQLLTGSYMAEAGYLLPPVVLRAQAEDNLRNRVTGMVISRSN